MRYFAVILAMGLAQFPTIQEYWEENAIGTCKIVRELMSRDEFWEISKNIH